MWPVQPCLSGDNDSIISGVDHLEFKSGRVTNNGGMRASLGHQYYTIGPSG